MAVSNKNTIAYSDKILFNRTLVISYRFLTSVINSKLAFLQVQTKSVF